MIKFVILGIPLLHHLYLQNALVRQWTQALTQGFLRINFRQNPRLTPALPTTSSPTTTLKTRLSRLFTQWWPIHAGGAIRPIVDVPLAPGKLRYTTAGAPVDDDDDSIRDEDATFPTPSPNHNSRPLAAGMSILDNMERTSRF
ncbi:uncharacterized protein HD556DRAFT_1302941 [Suillus plorans]|uniref:Uncharacterized protein n=1 Tax=Suillus plorans TaxID=116603 RepID=A0A9P7DYD9_9AGAM|nr:uncharacterized protein HD556DRAFT_1302941 [Suillus plorans]KAG1806484.1 hypothetical protein HD556DRAFT_1302941 [Suillus plorans]